MVRVRVRVRVRDRVGARGRDRVGARVRDRVGVRVRVRVRDRVGARGRVRVRVRDRGGLRLYAKAGEQESAVEGRDDTDRTLADIEHLRCDGTRYVGAWYMVHGHGNMVHGTWYEWYVVRGGT